MDRWDFTPEDGPFPMYVYRGGAMYSFCPGKATWDIEARTAYEVAIIAAETGAMFDKGGIGDQPTWFIGILGWFLPMYDRVKFASKAQSVLGGGGKSGKAPKKGGRRIGRKS